MARHWIIALCLICLAGCTDEEKPADLTNAKTYDRHGIRFSYPGNWIVSEETARSGFASVTIDSVYSFTIVQVYTPPRELLLDKYVDLHMKNRGKSRKVPVAGGLKLTYSERAGKRVKITRKTGGRIIEQIHQRFEGGVAGQMVSFLLKFEKIPWKHYTVFIITQSPEEDRPLVEPGYDLILETLVVDPAHIHSLAETKPAPPG